MWEKKAVGGNERFVCGGGVWISVSHNPAILVFAEVGLSETLAGRFQIIKVLEGKIPESRFARPCKRLTRPEACWLRLPSINCNYNCD